MSAGLFLVAALCTALPWHPNSWSMSKVVVDPDGEIVVFLRLQALSVGEVVTLDADANGLVEPAELQAVADEVAEYVLAHYRLRTDPDGEPLAGDVSDIALRNDDWDALTLAQYVDVELSFPVPGPLTALDVEMTLFLDTSPRHQDRCDVHWPGEPKQAAAFWNGHTRQTFRPDTPPPRTARDDLLLGAEHIVFGYDHIAFLLGLVVASSRLRSVIGVVTAFTLAHSATLTLAALDVVVVPARPVEIAIAVSIAWVGLANLVTRRPRPLWVEAFVFGLVHGLGFASALAQVLAVHVERLATLVLFNLGIELGQIAIVIAAVLLLKLLPRGAPERPGTPVWLAPRAVRVAASLVVFVLGSFWAVERLVGP